MWEGQGRGFSEARRTAYLGALNAASMAGNAILEQIDQYPEEEEDAKDQEDPSGSPPKHVVCFELS
jgi:hypothetical protein